MNTVVPSGRVTPTLGRFPHRQIEYEPHTRWHNCQCVTLGLRIPDHRRHDTAGPRAH